MKPPSPGVQKAVNRALPWVDVSVTIVLGMVFAIFFLFSHAWGAWGDDSPGYIYTAGQIANGEELVVQDELVQRGLERFEDEKLVRWLAPTHHEIISPDGWIASKYPIGLSWIMAQVAKLFSIESMYVVVPVLAVATVVMTYWLAIVWIPDAPTTRRVVGIVAALSVGLASLFSAYAVAQPMRDIPALAFMTAAVLGMGVYFKIRVGHKWLSFGLLLVSGGLLGMAMNIRETAVLLLVPLLAVLVWEYRSHWKQLLASVGMLLLGTVLVFSLSIWNSIQITEHKQNFRQKDVTNIAITSNIDHIQSLSFENIYNNQGKFKPGVGGANQYWQVMQSFSAWPPFIIMAIAGLAVLLWKHRREGIVFGFWVGSMFLLFSMWINPYPRYILSIVVPVALLAGYGTVMVGRGLWLLLGLKQWTWLLINLLIVASFLVSFRPGVEARQKFVLSDELVFKSISQQDLATAQQLAADIEVHADESEKPPLLLFFGQWKAGMSEMVMTHSSIRAIRFPGKANLQPDPLAMQQFIEELREDYTVYVWYDTSTSAAGQQLYNSLPQQPLHTYSFSFEDTIELSVLTQ